MSEGFNQANDSAREKGLQQGGTSPQSGGQYGQQDAQQPGQQFGSQGQQNRSDLNVNHQNQGLGAAADAGIADQQSAMEDATGSALGSDRAQDDSTQATQIQGNQDR